MPPAAQATLPRVGAGKGAAGKGAAGKGGTVVTSGVGGGALVLQREDTPGFGQRRAADSRGLALPVVAAGSLAFPKSGLASARTPRQPAELQRDVQERYGCSCDTLSLGDVQRNSQLRSDLASMPLSAYFDDRGVPHFRRLGLSFAARQNPTVRPAFGTWVDRQAEAATIHKRQSAKSYFLATEALEKDEVYGKVRQKAFLETLDASQKHRVEDVKRRQLEVLFSEIRGFEKHLPPGLCEDDLLPCEVTKEEERQNRAHFEKTNSYLIDRLWRFGAKSQWMLRRGEVLYLSLVCELWTKTTRGATYSLCLGMDRPTFCRLILDLGLVDQKRVPYFWAVSLFDDRAKTVRRVSFARDPRSILLKGVAAVGLDEHRRIRRCTSTSCGARLSRSARGRNCPPGGESSTFAHLSPLKPILSRWSLITILDTILRNHFDETTKGKFFKRLLAIAKLRLPAHVIEESGLQEHMFEQYLSNPDLLLLGGPHGEGGIEAFGGAKAPSASDGFDAKPGGVLAVTSEQELQREQVARDHLVRAMLIEPEVLHVLGQHRDVFDRLHSCYADTEGHMSYAALLQFCVDFQLSPRIASANFIKHVYETTRSLAHRQTRSSSATPCCDEQYSQVLSPTSARRPGGGSGQPAEPRSRMQKRSSPSPPPRRTKQQSRLRAGAVENPRIVELMATWPPELPWLGVVELSERVTDLHRPLRVIIKSARGLPFMNRGDIDRFSQSADSFCTCSIVGKPSDTLQTKVVNDSMEPVWRHEGCLKNYERGDALEFCIFAYGRSEPELCGRARLASEAFHKVGFEGELVVEAARGSPMHLSVKVSLDFSDAPTGGRLRSFFGVGAFIEALCRISFSYLGAYGNTQQQSSSGLGRVVWLTTYLRNVFVHLRQSLERRRKQQQRLEDDDPAVHPQLFKALAYTVDALWSTAPDPTAPRLPPTTMKLGLPKDGDQKRKKPRRRSEETIGGIKVLAFVGRARRRSQRAFLSMRTAPISCSEEREEVSQQVASANAVASVDVSLGVARATSSAGGSAESGSGSATAPADREQAMTFFPSEETQTRKVSLGSEAPPLGESSRERPVGAGGDDEEDDDSSSASRPASRTPAAAPPEKKEEAPVESRRQSADSALSPRRRAARLLAKGSAPSSPAPVPAQSRALPFKLKESVPLCVQGGRCQLCGGSAGPTRWGNATCRGCSIVDLESFRTHFLRPLLFDWHPSVMPEGIPAVLPSRLDRAPLTPPPLARNDALRG